MSKSKKKQASSKQQSNLPNQSSNLKVENCDNCKKDNQHNSQSETYNHFR